MQVGAETLIVASRRGDRDAFARIIERHQRAVYAVAFSGVRDRALADDVTQDTFVIAWRRLDELRDERRLAAWLCGIARNLARDLRKRSRRETDVDLDDVAITSTPYDEMTEAESERIVATALGQVPDVYREPLVLYYYEERSVVDVARSLGISPATTNKRLSRGRQYLAACVETVERGLSRRGPSPGLAASVLAAIGVLATTSHVDASPAAKGSTMHKLAIAAAVTVTAGAVGAIVVATTRSGDAHATSRSTNPTAAAAAVERGGRHTARTASGGDRGVLFDIAERLQRRPPSAARAGAGDGDAAGIETDCAAVGRHLAELEGDTTHGAHDRPDEESCARCAAHYETQCEGDGWSIERRICVLAAGDLINAHLCAGGAATTAPSDEPPASIPAHLTCATLAPHIATVAQGAGFHTDVTDMPDQIAAACELGAWSIELRTCFSVATSIDALQGCIAPSD